jgi:periplasmic protein TonB
MSAYVHDSSFFTRRSLVLAGIVLLHVFIAWALATGLARRAIELVAPPLQTEIVEEVQKKDQPPPPPPPQLERPPVEVPPPDIAIDLPVETQSTAIVDTTNQHVVAAPPPPPPPKPVNRVSPKPGKNFPATEDYYPAASQRMGEQGAVNVKACVGPNGKLTEDPTVAQTSGSSRLDDAAIKLAKAGSGHYQPGTADGQPDTACFVFRIKFELRN